MDQVRGGCGGGRQSVVKAPRGHALAALAVRAAAPAGQRERDAGHGGRQPGGDGRFGLRPDGQRRNPTGRSQGSGQGRSPAAPSAPARVRQEVATADHPILGRHAQPVVVEK